MSDFGKKSLSKKILASLPNFLFVLIIFIVALALRFIQLGNTFISSDNVELAQKIIVNKGYLWMIEENYGVLISFIVKVFVVSLSFLGVTVTEFWWKVPVAIIGSLQSVLVYIFLKKYLNVSKILAYFGATMIAILPIHVMQSRYLWGYEVLAVFFITLAIWSLLIFLRKPTLSHGLWASLFNGLYLISHGYILPYVLCVLLIILIYSDNERKINLKDILTRINLVFTKLVWIFPVLFLIFYANSLIHTFQKNTNLGFYVFDHLPGFVANVGIVLFVLYIFSIILNLYLRKSIKKEGLLFVFFAFFYLAPFFFGVPPDITVERGYMLMSAYFLLLSLVIIFDHYYLSHRKIIVMLMILGVSLTLWGTVESIFLKDVSFDPSLVKIERGSIDDTGAKAAGYITRKFISPEIKILAVNKAIEPPVLDYYFKRADGGYYDLSFELYKEVFFTNKDNFDIIIVDKETLPIVEADDTFIERIVLYSLHEPVMWIFAKQGVNIPEIKSDVLNYNKLYDKEFSPKISIY
ncbi:MAG: glycosyltransferase family 39 protein [bacterium]|nr:glycosyltransferase family 39 protein [bacterium]